MLRGWLLHRFNSGHNISWYVPGPKADRTQIGSAGSNRYYCLYYLPAVGCNVGFLPRPHGTSAAYSDIDD